VAATTISKAASGRVFLPNTPITELSTEYSLDHEFGGFWKDMEAVQGLSLPDDENPYRTSFDLADKGVPDLDPASVRLRACQHFHEEGNHVDALSEAEAGRVLAQEALVSAVEVYGYMPLSMVATLVVAYYNIGYQHVQMAELREGESWYRKALEIADRRQAPPPPTSSPSCPPPTIKPFFLPLSHCNSLLPPPLWQAPHP